MNFSQLKLHISQSLQQKSFRPCYLAGGDDAYLVAKSTEMLSAAIEIQDLNVSIISSSAGKDEVYGALQTLPFMSQYRLVIMDAKRFGELKEYLKNPTPSTIVLLTADAAANMAGVELIDCSRLSVSELARSCIYECEKNGAVIRQDAAEVLAEFCGRAMGRVKNELYKLIDSGQDVIDVETVRALVQPEIEYKVFELADAIVKKDAFRALSVLDDMMSGGYGAASKVFGLLYSHFRRLLAVSLSSADPALKDYLGIKDFAVTMAVRQAKAFSKAKLKRIVDRLHALDFALKTGKTGDKSGLLTFITETISEVN